MRTVPLGNSSTVKLGNGVVALGNAGGTGVTETVTGTITGLNQTITASDDGSGTSERLTDMLRTNAEHRAGRLGRPAGQHGRQGDRHGHGGGHRVVRGRPAGRRLRDPDQPGAEHRQPDHRGPGRPHGADRLRAASWACWSRPSKASTAASPSQQRSLQIQEDENGAGSPGVPKAGAACVPNNLEAGHPGADRPGQLGHAGAGRAVRHGGGQGGHHLGRRHHLGERPRP